MSRSDKTNKYYETYDYNSRRPVFIELEDLREDQQHRLIKSDVFCMIPWTHIHGFPTGEAYPCCLSEIDYPIGNMKENTLEEIWNGSKYVQMRKNMLADKPCKECTRCYEQEASGFFSMRNSHNKHFGHHINKVDQGTKPDFNIVYWDIRFSNLCNFKCRSCGDIFSSSWVKENKVRGLSSKDKPNVVYAGKFKLDIWEQLQSHLDTIEQVYFAGGEPLMMEEHWLILNALIARKRFDVKLIYNTNFSKMVYKGQNVLEIWKLFESVSVGASLDAMGTRAENMRKGTVWEEVEQNRRDMLEICPDVDFYISPTLSILNSHHIIDFHRDWVSKGLLKPQDLNVNILQSPAYYRIDVLPQEMKQKLLKKYKDHIEWLEPQDHLTRATNGFKSAIDFMMAKDNSDLIPNFIDYTNKFDLFRNENTFADFPELEPMNG
jgi:radical SAM protein with 4Fe4S-binding SPASM domain